MRRIAHDSWRRHVEDYAEEIAHMVRHFEAELDAEQYTELVRREFRVAWGIFSKRFGVYRRTVGGGPSYAYVVWRDAVARHMGWLRGRIGRSGDEVVNHRRLEKAGQLRLPV